MKDRFRFRVWEPSKKEMHYEDFVVTATGYIAPIDDHYDAYCCFDQTNFETDKNCIAMQCTGLKDKNGKLIFEGDIVKIFHLSSSGQPISFIGEVKYYQEQCYWGIKNDGAFATFLDTDDVFEVIGNIYDNKELME